MANDDIMHAKMHNGSQNADGYARNEEFIDQDKIIFFCNKRSIKNRCVNE